MSTRTRAVSSRDRRLAREQSRRTRDLLEVARTLLARGGVAGFSIEAVADEAGYTRTAIYRYFPSKEELILALALETAELRYTLWKRIEEFAARPRERLLAMGEVTSILYPRHVPAEIVALSNAVRAKTSPERQQALRDLEAEDRRLATSIVRDAVTLGDLELPRGLSAEELVFGLNVLSRGIFAGIAHAATLEELGVSDPRRTLRVLGRELLDGLGWRPLSSEWSYADTVRRIYLELYPPPVLAGLGLSVDEKTFEFLQRRPR